MLIRIDTDCLFITNRLREIDSSYFVVFNSKKNQYEVHSKRQAKNTFCVGLPFSKLDERTIDFVLKTRIENIDKIIEKIEKQNQKIDTRNLNNSLIVQGVCSSLRYSIYKVHSLPALAVSLTILTHHFPSVKKFFLLFYKFLLGSHFCVPVPKPWIY